MLIWLVSSSPRYLNTSKLMSSICETRWFKTKRRSSRRVAKANRRKVKRAKMTERWKPIKLMKKKNRIKVPTWIPIALRTNKLIGNINLQGNISIWWCSTSTTGAPVSNLILPRKIRFKFRARPNIKTISGLNSEKNFKLQSSLLRQSRRCLLNLVTSSC